MFDLGSRLSQQDASVAIGMLVVLFAGLLLRLIGRLIARAGEHGHLSPVMAGRLRVGVRWAVIILTPLFALQATGLIQNAWGLISAVIAAVAIGFFAMWSLLSNITAALLVVWFRPFRKGDHVELVEPSNGTSIGGSVVDINLMYTTLSESNGKSGEGVTLHVPNSLFFQKPVRTRAPIGPATEPFYRQSQAPAPREAQGD